MTDKDHGLRALLKVLLERVERIGKEHEELYDSEVREAMSAAIVRGFIAPEPGYLVPASFGMHSRSADSEIQAALALYIREASLLASGRELDEAARLRAFQDGELQTDGERQYYDDFFGWIRDES